MTIGRDGEQIAALSLKKEMEDRGFKANELQSIIGLCLTKFNVPTICILKLGSKGKRVF